MKPPIGDKDKRVAVFYHRRRTAQGLACKEKNEVNMETEFRLSGQVLC